MANNRLFWLTLCLFVSISATKTDGNVFLRGDFIELGLHPSGTFGSAVLPPSGYNTRSKAASWGNGLGFACDWEKNGWSTGTPAYSGDYVMPGASVEGFGVEFSVDGTEKKYTNMGRMGKEGITALALSQTTSDYSGGSATHQAALWRGLADSKMSVLQSINFYTNQLYITGSVHLMNVGDKDLMNVEYMRFIDPDQDQPWSATFLTKNFVQYNPYAEGDPADRVRSGSDFSAAVVATGATKNDLYLSLGSVHSTARANHFGLTADNADEIWANPLWRFYTSGSPRQADESIHLGFHLGKLVPGDAVRFSWTYVMLPTLLDEALDTIEKIVVMNPMRPCGGDCIFAIHAKNFDDVSGLNFYLQKEGSSRTSLGSCTSTGGSGCTKRKLDDGSGLFTVQTASSGFSPGLDYTLLIKATLDGTTYSTTAGVALVAGGPSLSITAPSGSGVPDIPTHEDTLVTVSVSGAYKVDFFREYTLVGGAVSQKFGTASSSPWKATLSVADLPTSTPIIITAVAYTSDGKSSTASIRGMVKEVNRAPYDMELSGNSIQENTAINAVIGTLSTSDPNLQDTFTYTVPTNPDAKFGVVGSQLVVKKSLNYEDAASYIIKVRTTDAGGMFFEKEFTINVVNLNEAPTGITIDNDNVNENSAVSTVVGYLSAVDQDVGQLHAFFLRNDAGGRFKLVGNQLQTATVLDYESGAEYSIVITCTDNGSPKLSFSAVLKIKINDINEPPTKIILNPASVGEDAGVDSVVGTLTCEDPDKGQSYTWTMRDSADGVFKIVDDTVKVASATLDHEETASMTIKVRVTDSGTPAESMESYITIQINDIDEEETTWVLTLSVKENSPKGTMIGSMRPSGSEKYDFEMYEDYKDGGSGVFDISKCSGAFEVAQSNRIDYEVKNKYEFKIKVTNERGESEDKLVTVNVIDVNEPPILYPVEANVPENSAKGTVVLTSIPYTDPDAGDVMTFSIVSGNTGGIFRISDTSKGKIIVDSAGLNFEGEQQQFNLVVTCEDSGRNGASTTVVIDVTDVNEEPTVLTPLPIVLEIEENSPVGTKVGLPVEMVDPDTGQLLAFDIKSGNTNDIFEIDSEGGYRFTTTADFESAFLKTSLNTTSNELKLSSKSGTFPFIWIALSGRGTIGKVDTNTGVILGEYKSAPDGRGRNPSRTTVDLNGNVWCGNRDEYSAETGSVVRVGLQQTYQCVDRNENGKIDTSGALGDVRAWPNTGGADNNGGVRTSADECIINYVRTPNVKGVREVVIDSENNVWIGSCHTTYHTLASGTVMDDWAQNWNKAPLAEADWKLKKFHGGCGGYGGVIDKNNVLWSARCGGLLRYDINTGAKTCLGVSNGYGLGIDQAGDIWNSRWTSCRVSKFSPGGTLLWDKNPGGCGNRGISMTSDGSMWIANSVSNSVSRLRIDGHVLAVIAVGNHPTGTAVDSNGKVWVTNYSSSSAMRINPATNKVDLTVALGSSANPYDYSDMTGSVAFTSTVSQGQWAANYDSGEAGTRWGIILWRSMMPSGSSITVRARSSADSVSFSGYADVSNGIDFDVPDNRYLQVEMTLKPTKKGLTPTVYDLTVAKTPPDTPGQIKVAKAQLNYETTSSYNLEVRATDNGSPQKSKIVAVKVNVINLNEAPTIGAAYTLAIDENSAIGTNIGSPLRTYAADQDAGTELTYAIVDFGDYGAGAFDMHPGTGQLSVKANLNYEVINKYILKARVTDQGGLYAETTLTVNINQKNEAPSLVDLTLAGIDENSGINSMLRVSETNDDGDVVVSTQDWTICAVDEDAGQTLTFTLSGDGSDMFALTASSSPFCTKMKVAKAGLDFETRSLYSLTLAVKDNGSPTQLSDSATITVKLHDVNEIPAISNQARSIMQTGTAGDNIGGPLTISDPDSDQTHVFEITSGDTDKFEIVAATGQLRRKTSLTLSSSETFPLGIKVTDSGGLSDTCTVTISVVDENEEPVCFQRTFGINENSAVNTNVGSPIGCVDPDKDTLTYTILTGDIDNAFKINSATGQIQVRNAVLNYEMRTQYVLTIEAKDDGEGTLSTGVEITVNIINLNEAPAVADQTRKIPENSPINSVVGAAVVATDPDAGQTLSYSIIAGNTNSMFDISPTTGQITVAKKGLNFEIKASYDLTVRVTDNGSPVKQTSAAVLIAVEDVNDAPQLSNAGITVAENLPVGAQVGTALSASDEDAMETLTWAITGGNCWRQLTTDEYKYEFYVFDVDTSDTALRFTVDIKAASYAHILLSPGDSDAGALYELVIGTGAGKNELAIRRCKNACPKMSATQSNLLNAEEYRTFWVVKQGGAVSFGTGKVFGSNVLLSYTDPDPITVRKVAVSTGWGVAGEFTRLCLSQETGSGMGVFRVDGSGQLFVKEATLNYESIPIYSIMVTVTDSGGLTASAVAKISLTNVNEPPVMPRTCVTEAVRACFSVPENKPENTAVGVPVSASDPDSGTWGYLQFSITSGNTGDAFFINADSGQIYLKKGGLDHEDPTTLGKYELGISVQDGGGLVTTGSVIIYITDVNEAPTMAKEYIISVNENSNAYTPVGSPVIGSDVDDGVWGELTYNITGGDGAEEFTIDPRSAQVEVKNNNTLNYEAKNLYTLNVIVTDGGGLSATSVVKIHILNVNEPPVIPAPGRSTPITLTVPENSPVNFKIGAAILGYDIEADPDFGGVQTLLYSTTGGDGTDLFRVGACTAQVEVKLDEINYEVKNRYNLTITVTDDGLHPPRLTDSTTIFIDVIDVNEAPTLHGTSFDIDENSPAGTSVGNPATMGANDVDAGQTALLKWSITDGNEAGDFYIEEATGQLKVTANDSLNFEHTNMYHLEITVTDPGNLTAVALVSVSVLDVDEPPVLLPTTREIAENSANSTTVGDPVTGTDQDDGSSISYSILTPGMPFAVFSDSGQLYVTDGAALNYEVTQKFTFTMMAKDNTNLTCNATIVVDVLDVNEQPILLPSNRSVYENATTGHLINPVIQAHDQDIDYNPDVQSVTYRIIDGNPGGLFSLDSMTGQLEVKMPNSLDFETAPVFHLTILVRDTGIPALQTTAVITINVLDVNEPPSMATFSRTIPENSDADLDVGLPVFGTDPDFADTLTYSLPHSNQFYIESADNQGQLKVMSGAVLDFETEPVINLIVTVHDKDDLQANGTVVISLTNVNEPPVLPYSMIFVKELSEYPSKVGRALGQIAYDLDGVDTLTFGIDSGNDEGVFAIDSQTGQITVASGKIVGEYGQFGLTYNMTCRVTDHAGLFDTNTVSVNVTEENQIPIFNDTTLNVNENSAVDTVVTGLLVALDKDNDVLTYSWNVDPGIFKFGEVTVRHYDVLRPGKPPVTYAEWSAQVLVNGELDFEKTPYYVFTAKVTDLHKGTTMEDTAQVTIDVNNLNEAPVIEDQTITFDEDVALDTVVGTLTSFDQDDSSLAWGQVTYASTCSDPVKVETDGNVVVTQKHDHETTDTYTCSITVTDGGGLSDTATLTLVVQDVNEKPFVNDASFSLWENSALGFTVGHIIAGDVDEVDVLSYSLQMDAMYMTAFRVNSSGYLLVANEVDYERFTNYTFTVTVTDKGGLSATANVHVTVKDKEDMTITDITGWPIPTDASSGVTIHGTNFGMIDMEEWGIEIMLVQYGLKNALTGKWTPTYTASCTRDAAVNTKILCDPQPGIGMNQEWRVIMNRTQQQVSSGSVLTRYAAPEITDILNAENMPTKGNVSIDLIGANFGPAGSPVNIKYVGGGLTKTAKNCVVLGHTLVRCLSVPSVGKDLTWTASVAGQSNTPWMSVKSSYAPPKLVAFSSSECGITNMKTSGGEIICFDATNVGVAGTAVQVTYGGADGAKYTASSCHVTVDHSKVRCYTAIGVGKELKWVVYVGGQQSSLSGALVSNYIGPKIDEISGPGFAEATTRGGENLYLSGSNFGPIGTIIENATYGALPDANHYTAEECQVVAPHTQIRCRTAPGVGKDLGFRLRIGDQNTFIAANISYGPPTIYSYSGACADDCPTEGRDWVIITGDNFGYEDDFIDLVTYGPQDDKKEYVAYDCYVNTSFSAIKCKTLPGAGKELLWIVRIAGQDSVVRTTNYAPPTIDSFPTDAITADPSSLSTDGGEQLQLKGTNFGPKDTDYLEWVKYGKTGKEYIASGCTVTGHGFVLCNTVPGIGANLYWTIRIKGQTSVLSAQQTTYALPTIETMEPSSGVTDGNYQVVLTGKNFYGRPGDKLLVKWMDHVGMHAPIEGIKSKDGSIHRFEFTAPSGYGANVQVSLLIGFEPDDRESPARVFVYDAPTVSNVNTEEGDTSDEILVNVLGASFGEEPGYVYIGGLDDETLKTSANLVPQEDITLWKHEKVTVRVKRLNGYLLVVTKDDRSPQQASYFENISPQIGFSKNDEGYPLVPGHFATDGSSLLYLNVTYLGEHDISITVANKTCPIRDDMTYNTTDATDPLGKRLVYHIFCEVPAGQGSDNRVIVKRGTQESFPALMSYYPPSVDSVSTCGATSGCPQTCTCVKDGSKNWEKLCGQCSFSTTGGTIRLTGSNLYGDIDPELVWYFRREDGSIYRSLEATVVSKESSFLVVKVPAGEAEAELQIRVGDQDIYKNIPTGYISPHIVDIQPKKLNTTGGQLVITGTNLGINGFAEDTANLWNNKLTINGIPCQQTSFQTGVVIDASEYEKLTCQLPEGRGEDLTVAVTVGDRAGTSAKVFGFLPPQVFSVTPDGGPTSGNVPITLEGINFGPVNGTIDLEYSSSSRRLAAGTESVSVPLENVLVWNHTCIIFMLPEGQGDKLKIIVNAGGPSSLTITKTFSYDAPTLDRCDPADIGNTKGGDIITLHGVSFGTKYGVVEVNGTQAELLTQTHNAITFVLPAGMGAGLPVSLLSGNQMSKNTVPFSYSKVVVQEIDPKSPAPTGGTDVRFRAENLGITDDPRNKVEILVGGKPCTEANFRSDDHFGSIMTYLICKSPSDVVGWKNLTISVALQTKHFPENGAVRMSYKCNTGYFGQRRQWFEDTHEWTDVENEWCAPCPLGGSCPGLVWGNQSEPTAEAGFWLMHLPRSDGLCSKEHDERPICPVPLPCRPSEACLERNNCSTGYTGTRCVDCVLGEYYRRGGVCVKCPNAPMLLVGGFLLAAVLLCVAGYFLNKKNVSLSFMSIGVDYFQVLAMFARSNVAWPQMMKDIFEYLSAFNLNIEIAAPECAIPEVGFKTKFFFIQSLQLAAGAIFLIMHFMKYIQKRCIRGRKKDLHKHVHALVATFLVVEYYLYLVQLRMSLDVFNCNPTNPDDGYTYMDAVMEKCYEPGGIHLALLPWAVGTFLLFGVGFPVLLFRLLYKNRERIMEDQLLRSKRLGDDRNSNRNCYELRKRYHKIYYHFRPDKYYWILCIVLRKFGIAFTALMFRDNAGFQLAVVLLVLFTSFCVHVRCQPYMSPSEHEQIIKMWEERIANGDLQAGRIMQRVEVNCQSRKGRKQLTFDRKTWNAQKKVMNHIVNYNSTESIMLVCAFLITLGGIMFESGYMDSDVYQGQRDFLTVVLLLIMFFSFIYFGFVLVSEIKAVCGKDAPTKGKGRGKLSGASGGMQDIEMAGANDEEMVISDTQLNPMFVQAKNSAGQLQQATGDAWKSQKPPDPQMWNIIRAEYTKLKETLDEMQKSMVKQAKESQLEQYQPGGAGRMRQPGGRNKKTFEATASRSARGGGRGRGRGRGGGASATKGAWQSAVDPRSGKTYYVNKATKKTQWQKPEDFDG